MFDRELDYYGITSVGGVSDQASLPEIIDSFTLNMRNAIDNQKNATDKHYVFVLAYEIYSEYCKHRINNPKSESCMVKLNMKHQSFRAKSYLETNNNKRKSFDTYFERYFGLKVPAESHVHLGGGVIQVDSIKKNE